MNSEEDIIAGKKSTIKAKVKRYGERKLVKEFLMKNTKRSGFGGVDIKRTPNGTEVTVHAERPGLVIGRKGKIIKELESRLKSEFELFDPQLKVEEIKSAESTANAQVMAEKIASALERGWYYRRAGNSAAENIMTAGARGVIVTLAGKLTGSRNRTQKFIKGHVKYCGETALLHMDKGYSVAVKKLGTIGVTVEIMRANTRLPHEITIFSNEELLIREDAEAASDTNAEVTQ